MYNTRPVSELEVPYPLSGQIIENKYPCPQSGCELLEVFQDLETLRKRGKRYQWNLIYSQIISDFMMLTKH